MKARRRFGQHFLEPAWTARVVDAIAPSAQDVFLEIGPGRGALTLPLAARTARIVAIEIDRDLAAGLAARAPSNVRIVTGDVLHADLAALIPDDGRPLRVAGNLPYNVSSPILGVLFDWHLRDARLVDATLMLQREVADRLLAAPGTREYGVLTVGARRHAQVERLLSLPPGAFRPAPKVHSAVVRLRFRAGEQRVSVPGVFDALVRGVFGQRRKRLSNALRPLAETLGVSSAAILGASRIDPGRRPETLSLEEFIHLAEALEQEVARRRPEAPAREA